MKVKPRNYATASENFLQHRILPIRVLFNRRPLTFEEKDLCYDEQVEGILQDLRFVQEKDDFLYHERSE
jgi:hypothetical protein